MKETKDYKNNGLESMDVHHPTLKLTIDIVNRWIKQKEEGHSDISLVICGGVGVGKTHIARTLLTVFDENESIEPWRPYGSSYSLEVGANKRTELIRGNALIQTLGPEYFTTDLILTYCTLVIIDDVGDEQQIPFMNNETHKKAVQVRYNRFIDYCQSKRISIVITSNFPLNRLAEHIGDRAWDRLCKMAPKGFMIEIFDVGSYRQISSGRQNRYIAN